MEGLRDVTEEVDEEFHGLLAVRGREAIVVDALGVVCDCGDDAARGIAIAGKIDGARGWRRVLCIDEAGVTFVSESRMRTVRVKGSLIGRSEFPCCCVAIIICPTGD